MGTAVVAMSGGVDSAAAALLLAERGYGVIGVSMQVWDYRRGSAKRATCCSPADFDDARRIAALGGFPFYVFDFEETFAEEVIRPFVASYLNGVTPNPCVECNRRVKFRELRHRARALGADFVATGHYARIRPKADGRLGLYTAVDLTKDQSYFLYALTQDELRSTLFPVGEMKKTEVRSFLHERQVRIAAKPESQDICFVSGTVAEFVESASGVKPQRGAIVNEQGRELGEHSGVHHFTVGQRRGLGVSGAERLYVLRVDAEKNQVVVGRAEELRRNSFMVRNVSWASGEPPPSAVRSRVKMRYRHAGVLAEVIPLDRSSARVEFVDGWSSVSPGQAAVFYSQEENDGWEVLGGGTIVSNSRFD